MYPKIRSPLGAWLLTVFTGGIYLYYWAWRVANEFNSAEGKKVLNIDFWAKGFIALLLLAFVGLLFALYSDNPIPIVGVGLLLFAFLVHVQLSIGNYIKAKDNELNTGASFSNTLAFVLLWLVANAGVAYMQIGINRIITNARARS